MALGNSRRELLRHMSVAGTALAMGSIASNDAVAQARQTARSNDSLVINGLDPSAITMEVVNAQRAGGVDCWVMSSVGVNADVFADGYALMAQNSDKVAPAFSVRDIRAARRENKLAIVFGWQDAAILSEEGDSEGPAIHKLDLYHQRGLRICGIAYNLANQFGGGNLDSEIGLTRNGRELVERIHKLRIALDVGGHTGEQTSLDAIAMSAGVPVVCTHTNILRLVDNPRNTSDRVLEAIAKTGGVIGVTAFNDFHIRTRQDVDKAVLPQVTLDKHLDQYDYLKKLVGADHIGLGPDFTAGRRARRTDGEVLRPSQRLNPNGSVNRLSPESYTAGPWDERNDVQGFQTIAELPNVSRGLAQRGWTPAEIRKVMGDNWARVYENIWGA